MNFNLKENNLFLYGLLSGYAVFLITTIGSIFLIPLILEYLSQTEYGAYSLILEIFGWLIVTDLGVVSVFNSKGAHLTGNSNNKEFLVYFNTVFFSHIFSVLLPVIALILLSSNWKIILGQEASSIDNIGPLIFLFSISFLIDYLLRPLKSLLWIRKKVHQINLLELLFFCIRFLFIVVALYFNYGIVALGYATLVARIVVAIIMMTLTKKDISRLSLNNFDKRLIKYLFKNGLWITIGGLAGILILRTDSFLISRFFTLSMVGTFYINKRLWDYAEKLHSRYLDTSRPFLSNLFKKESKIAFSKKGKDLHILSLGLSVFIGSVVFVFSRVFVTMLAGDNIYLGEAINALFFVQFLVQTNVLPMRIVLATSLFKVRNHNIARIVEGTSKILLSLFMIGKLGLSGLILSGILTSILTSHIFLGVYVSELTSLKLSHKLVPLVLIMFITVLLVVHTEIAQEIVLGTFVVGGLCFWRLLKRNDLTLREILLIH